jgi:hypothetical protein
MRIIIPVLLILVALAVVIQTPGSISRRALETINAPSATFFPHINDFHRWTAWSPFEKMDPALQRSYAGPSSGVGAAYGWVGNSKVGEGSMKITESTPTRKVGIALEFMKPFKASNVATFTLTPEAGGATRVTWAMDGQSTFVSKAMGLFMSMDRMIGGIRERTGEPEGIAEGGATS